MSIPVTVANDLEFYASASSMSELGRHEHLFEALPRDVASLARVVPGLVLHEYMASCYGTTIPDDRRSESHLRPVEQMLDALLAVDDRPLAIARPPERRLVGVCRHFALLFVAMLRAQSVPARTRVGYAAYLNPGYFENHWVGEYWNADQARWVLVDPQLDDVLTTKFLNLDFDPLDVPRDQFISAGDAWVLCRAGDADPARFGIFIGNLRGLWFIAGDLVREVAALSKREMLAWDVWGAMPSPGQSLSDDELTFFDGLASLTRPPDGHVSELRRFHEKDDRLRIPATVFNAVRNRPETL